MVDEALCLAGGVEPVALLDAARAGEVRVGPPAVLVRGARDGLAEHAMDEGDGAVVREEECGAAHGLEEVSVEGVRGAL